VTANVDVDLVTIRERLKPVHELAHITVERHTVDA
jgi:hypothetical protein